MAGSRTITVDCFDHWRVIVGTSTVRITAEDRPTNKGVLLKASKNNTGCIYIGNSDVTAKTAVATDGFELARGESLMLEVDNANKAYALADTAGQDLYVVFL